jgi:hypothetical protein
LHRRNRLKIKKKIKEFEENKISKDKFVEILNGWNAYTKWANNYNLKKSIFINP